MSCRDTFDLTPQQHHSGLDKLWAALGVTGVQDEDVFTLCARRINELNGALDDAAEYLADLQHEWSWKEGERAGNALEYDELSELRQRIKGLLVQSPDEGTAGQSVISDAGATLEVTTFDISGTLSDKVSEALNDDRGPER